MHRCMLMLSYVHVFAGIHYRYVILRERVYILYQCQVSYVHTRMHSCMHAKYMHAFIPTYGDECILLYMYNN